MMKWCELAELTEQHFCIVYPTSAKESFARFQTLKQKAGIQNDQADVVLVSSPGRVEIGGNHTDHQGGHVLASAISLDDMALVIKRYDHKVYYVCDGYAPITVDISDDDIRMEEKGKTASLIRGIAHGLKAFCEPCGMTVYCDAEVMPGSGLSSSAAFELLIVHAWKCLLNLPITAVQQAQIAQAAEVNYFGKPCGLMDQLSISVGGLVGIDFKNPSEPIIDRIETPDDFPYDFVLTECGSHANLTDAYASIPRDMNQVAACLGKKRLSECSIEDVLTHMEEIHDVCGDRALLRAMHELMEDQRILEEIQALRSNDTKTFRQLVLASGHSSFEYLNNVIVPNDTNQSMAVALAVSQSVLEGKGAWRVHGGGFAGTILALVPHELLQLYCSTISQTCHTDSHILQLRPYGTTQII